VNGFLSANRGFTGVRELAHARMGVADTDSGTRSIGEYPRLPVDVVRSRLDVEYVSDIMRRIEAVSAKAAA
jgi:hypothetical protein